MRRSAALVILNCLTSTMILAFLTTLASAQAPKFSNVDLCDGKDRTSTRSQIVGCSALIKSNVNDPPVSASAYNNRGNAFSEEKQYDLAIRDYDDAIKLNPNFA